VLGNLLFKLVRSSDGLRERLWKLAYETFPKVLPDTDWWFMNYGYEPTIKALIKKRVPFWLRGMFTEFAGNVCSQLYERLKNGEIQYRRIVAQRPA
jgi:hypothetical protein